MLTLEGVSFRYQPDEPEVISGFDHTFERATTYAVRADSGGGKSTLLYLCGLLLTPTYGAIFIDGKRVDDLPDRRRSDLRASMIGFVFQDAFLDTTRSVIDNVLEGAAFARMDGRAARLRAEALLDRFGVAPRGHARASDLSGGQAQRVGLCRALLKRPRLLLADEPTGNLDRTNGSVVMDHLLEASREHGATVLIATHDDDLASQCDARLSLDAP